MTLDRALGLTVAMLVAMVVALGCSGGGGSGTGGQGGAMATGGTAPGGTGGTGTEGASVGSGGATTQPSGCGAGGTGGAATTFPNVGVKGERGQATANATSFVGWEESFIIGEEGFGSDVCAVRFDLKRVGDAPAGCAECLWTHLLEYSNPRVMTDTGGACANSELALTADAIARKVGTRVAIGYVNQVGGAHGSARFKYFECTKMWDVSGNATWVSNPDAGNANAFNYTFRNGNCNYGP